MQNKTLKKMIKTTTKFINKNRHILCVIVCLVLVILLVNKLSTIMYGDIKEKFYPQNSEEYLNCINNYAGTNPMRAVVNVINYCKNL